MTELTVPALIRGRLVTEAMTRIAGPSPEATFWVPEPMSLLEHLPLGDPLRMRDLYQLSVDDIVEFLAQVGPRLALDRNPLLRDALEHSEAWSDMTPSLLESAYGQLPSFFTPESVLEVAERTIGIRFLDGWGDVGGASVRAFGARTVHVIAGNSPIIAAITIVRNALTRGDAIIKSPSNDPLTALAIARTMVELAPDHPLTRHLSVAYWKGGTEEFERRLYRPENVEKIVAWGGFASIRYVTRYIQPGLELIALDPKLSATVIGPEAFADQDSMAETARLAAADVGVLNQLGCFNARVIYAVTGTDPAGLERANRWGQLLYDAIVDLPAQVSTKARHFDPDLRSNVLSLHAWPDFYQVVGGRDDEGAVIISQLGEPVEFHTALAGRVANVVPVASAWDAVKNMNAYTQTVGVYPESLKTELRDAMPLYGTQRVVSLGYSTHFRSDLPQDAMEPTRRMVKWIVDETYRPEKTHPLSHLYPEAGPWRARGDRVAAGRPAVERSAADPLAADPLAGDPLAVNRSAVERLAADFDHHDPAFTPDLACEVHRTIRERGRVTYSRAYGGVWVLSHYGDVLAALNDHQSFSSASGVFFPRAAGTPPFAPLEYDPPEQTTFRNLMKPPFAIGETRRLAPQMQALVAEAVAPLVARGHGDLVAELCVPLPLAVVALAVGFSAVAQSRIRQLTSNTWAKMPTEGNAEGFWPQFAALFQSEIRQAREAPRDDYLSTLVNATIDGRPVTDDELHVMLVAFAIAGHETSMNTLAHMLWQLARRPDLQDRLRAEPDLVAATVEETLRLWAPVDHGTRFTTRDVEIDGVTIPSGSRVILLTGAANRDPDVFAAPDEFQPDRGRANHLTFGHGIHFCLGAHLARMEFQAVLRELVRYPNYTLTGDAHRYYEAGRHVCIDQLPVQFG